MPPYSTPVTLTTSKPRHNRAEPKARGEDRDERRKAERHKEGTAVLEVTRLTNPLQRDAALVAVLSESESLRMGPHP